MRNSRDESRSSGAPTKGACCKMPLPRHSEGRVAKCPCLVIANPRSGCGNPFSFEKRTDSHDQSADWSRNDGVWAFCNTPCGNPFPPIKPKRDPAKRSRFGKDVSPKSCGYWRLRRYPLFRRIRMRGRIPAPACAPARNDGAKTAFCGTPFVPQSGFSYR